LDEKQAEHNHPECLICHGSSWLYPRVNGKVDFSKAKRCQCMKTEDEAKNQAWYRKYCKLPEDAISISLDKFRVSDGKKPYPCLKEARDLALQLAEGKGDKGDIRWLTLMAQRDRGKSYLAKCICKRWLERGLSARYTSVPDLVIELREGFKQKGEQGYYSLYQFFCKVSLLVLDDLGMEHHSSDNDWAMEQLESIINNRYENELYLIVTTNKAMDEISPRIASRLQRYTKSRIVVLDDSPEYRLWKNK
jgi:DNA replication protein DnaC